jgi:hypothetical protein
MAYQLSWDVPQHVLSLKLSGDIRFQDFVDINRLVHEYLQESDRQIALMVDVSETKTLPGAIEQIKTSQSYLYHANMAWILVIGSSKLLRLTTLLIYNMGRPSLRWFDRIEQAQHFLQSSRFAEFNYG